MVIDRRTLIAGAAAGATIGNTGVAAAAAAEPDYPIPHLTFAFQIDAMLGTIREVGQIDGMRRRIVPILGGTIAGPRLTGKVLPGGADWQGVRPSDGLTRIYARYWLEAADGATIGVENRGVRRAPPEVMKRLMAGEIVPPSAYYFRANPIFETGADAHRWMDESLFVCVGARLPDRAIIRVYAVD